MTAALHSMKSVAIMLYIAQRYEPTPLLPIGDSALLARCLQLTVFGETEIGANLNPLLAARFGAPEADKRNWSVLGNSAAGEARRRVRSNARSGPITYLVGEDLTLADISVSCGLGIWQGALGGALPGRARGVSGSIARAAGIPARTGALRGGHISHIGALCAAALPQHA